MTLDSLDRRAGARFAGADGNRRLAGRDTSAADFPKRCCRRSKPAAKSSPPSRSIWAPSRRPASDQPVDREIPPENYRFDQFPEYLKLRQTHRRDSTPPGLANPYFNVHEGVINDTHDDRRPGVDQLLQLQLRGHVGRSGAWPRRPRRPSTATARAFRPAGWCPGEKAIHRELEQAIAEFLGTEDGDRLRRRSRHERNDDRPPVRPRRPDPARRPGPQQHRPRVPSSPAPGAGRSRTTTGRRSTSCSTELRHEYRRVLIAIEGVYSMDGDIPDLPRFVEVKKRHKALLMIDEAHSIGVLGRHGPRHRRALRRRSAATSTSGWARSASRSAVAADTSPAARPWSSTSSTRPRASCSAWASRRPTPAAALAVAASCSRPSPSALTRLRERLASCS